jgi:hypothetical protein
MLAKSDILGARLDLLSIGRVGRMDAFPLREMHGDLTNGREDRTTMNTALS